VTNGTFTVDAAAPITRKINDEQVPGGKKQWRVNEAHLWTQRDSENKIECMANYENELPEAFQIAFQAALQPYYFRNGRCFVASDASQVATLAKTTLEKMKALDIGGLGKMENRNLRRVLKCWVAIRH